MIKTIEPQAFDLELQSHGEPFLVAFLKRNERFAFQTEIMDTICKSHGNTVRCFLYDSDYLDTAMERFSVEGTPTFLLFSQGREVNRLIGESDDETLDEFIRECLQM
ncbi:MULTISPECIES: thioredoxin family protein [unclassified Pseudodesulfovibrio]|uniref:thioredoxin family protein n=1 Tax=unclassified Pseudodesulfovibrio TaxID=2661612 RepID=UPI000FEBFF42|nr:MULTISPECIES: thioredoxin family protein [unclassified Pseudodesulfovibrio]MCJ2165067.1 thioredoxin family protein [Pseudodesulfovibrio sp. S3-i]RWU03492.1 thioredoxin [Pseudodesulfovibrio sp. S3]